MKDVYQVNGFYLTQLQNYEQETFQKLKEILEVLVQTEDTGRQSIEKKLAEFWEQMNHDNLPQKWQYYFEIFSAVFYAMKGIAVEKLPEFSMEQLQVIEYLMQNIDVVANCGENFLHMLQDIYQERKKTWKPK